MKQLYFLTLFSLLSLHLNAQHSTVSGLVKTTEGPVPYASVGLIGTSYGATVSGDGSFKISNVPAGVYKLRVSAVGLNAHEEKITLGDNENTFLDVVLQQDASRLREVVVTGNMRETYLLESAVPVEIYTSKYFQKNPTPALFEALEIINGVQPQINCDVCGTGDIHINRMEGAYTMVLIDGTPPC